MTTDPSTKIYPWKIWNGTSWFCFGTTRIVWNSSFYHSLEYDTRYTNLNASCDWYITYINIFIFKKAYIVFLPPPLRMFCKLVKTLKFWAAPKAPWKLIREINLSHNGHILDMMESPKNIQVFVRYEKHKTTERVPNPLILNRNNQCSTNPWLSVQWLGYSFSTGNKVLIRCKMRLATWSDVNSTST